MEILMYENTAKKFNIPVGEPRQEVYVLHAKLGDDPLEAARNAVYHNLQVVRVESTPVTVRVRKYNASTSRMIQGKLEPEVVQEVTAYCVDKNQKRVKVEIPPEKLEEILLTLDYRVYPAEDESGLYLVPEQDYMED